MASIDIPLNFTKAELKTLYSYPNIPGSDESLKATIEHWFHQTLVRDGLKEEFGHVREVKGTFVIHLEGPSADENALYAKRLPGLLQIGLEAHNRIEKVVKPHGKWDPTKTDKWRFFLTLGVGIVNFRSLQFFHYPPLRLLDPLRDSMNDPVTARCRDLLEANGVLHDPQDNQRDQTRLYETRINSTPIAAPDDQGTPKKPYRNKIAPDPITGSYIPLEYFNDFQMKMIQLYLHEHPTKKGYTIPMIAYGRTPRKQLAGQWVGPDCAAVLQILPEKAGKPGEAPVDVDHYLKTPVLGSNHPYLFYVAAQEDKARKWNVGCGYLVTENLERCISLMRDDLAVTYWQVKMADDPSRDPWSVLNAARKYWNDPKRLLDVCALIWRQASLYYAPDDPDGNDFTFGIDDWKKARKAIQDFVRQTKADPVEFLKVHGKKATDAKRPISLDS